MTESLNSVLEQLKQELAQVYGERLKGLFVFGSHARGEATPDSDLDILIVLDQVGVYSAEIKRTSHLIARLSLDACISLSRVFISESDWRTGQSPFLLNVREEAVPA